MKYLLAQDTAPRFKWELEVVLTNIYSLDKDAKVVVLFSVEKENDPLVEQISTRYPQAEVHAYIDTRQYRSYVATMRPFLWYCYLTEDPAREQDTYFQIDSDVIFRELPDWSKIPYSEKVWYGSDCERYLGANYIKGVRNGQKVFDNFSRITGLPTEVLETVPGAGAQWVLCKPTAEYWLKVLNDAAKLDSWLDITETDIQKWTAEMWAQLYASYSFGIEQRISPELDFCWPYEPLERWHATKILHNAGVTGEHKGKYFDKNEYIKTTPYDVDFSWVPEDSCSSQYVRAVKRVMV